MKITEVKNGALPHIITSDGVTVWINGGTGLLGRFGRAGIDIHRAPEEQKISGECLFCTRVEEHTQNTTRDDWDLFVAKMLEHYRIEVPAQHMPDRCRTGTRTNSDSRVKRRAP